MNRFYPLPIQFVSDNRSLKMFNRWGDGSSWRAQFPDRRRAHMLSLDSRRDSLYIWAVRFWKLTAVIGCILLIAVATTFFQHFVSKNSEKQEVIEKSNTLPHKISPYHGNNIGIDHEYHNEKLARIQPFSFYNQGPLNSIEALSEEVKKRIQEDIRNEAENSAGQIDRKSEDESSDINVAQLLQNIFNKEKVVVFSLHGKSNVSIECSHEETSFKCRSIIIPESTINYSTTSSTEETTVEPNLELVTEYYTEQKETIPTPQPIISGYSSTNRDNVIFDGVPISTTEQQDYTFEDESSTSNYNNIDYFPTTFSSHQYNDQFVNEVIDGTNEKAHSRSFNAGLSFRTGNEKEKETDILLSYVNPSKKVRTEILNELRNQHKISFEADDPQVTFIGLNKEESKVVHHGGQPEIEEFPSFGKRLRKVDVSKGHIPPYLLLPFHADFRARHRNSPTNSKNRLDTNPRRYKFPQYVKKQKPKLATSSQSLKFGERFSGTGSRNGRKYESEPTKIYARRLNKIRQLANSAPHDLNRKTLTTWDTKFTSRGF